MALTPQQQTDLAAAVTRIGGAAAAESDRVEAVIAALQAGTASDDPVVTQAIADLTAIASRLDAVEPAAAAAARVATS